MNNAGLPGQTAGLLDLDLDHFDGVVAVNLRAPLVATKAVAPTMIGQGSGSVINVASVSGLRAGYPGHDYSTAKAGLIHLTRSLAVELAAHGVRVNSISPGPDRHRYPRQGYSRQGHRLHLDAGSADGGLRRESCRTTSPSPERGHRPTWPASRCS